MSLNLAEIPPPFWLLVGAAILAVTPTRWHGLLFLVFPAAALASVWIVPDGEFATAQFLQYKLVLGRADAFTRIFGMAFAIVGVAGGLYAFHLRSRWERIATLLYAAGALGVTFAGDYLTLWIWWEVMAVASAVLIFCDGSARAISAGMRYFIMHLLGGSCVLGGIAILAAGGSDLQLAALDRNGASIAEWLIFAGVCVNCAVIPVHAWLSDSYPKATVTGAVFLSAFTTKSAVYVLARLFPGWELLIGLGALMVIWGTVYALMSDDIRGVLAYSTISQVGYMVAGVGIGTELALNGVAAHGFCHITYKALLFMAAGAVIYATGQRSLARLGGLWPQLKWIAVLYIVGGLAISGAPLLNGFVSKSIIVKSAHESHFDILAIILLLGAVGSFLHTGLRVPFFTWWSESKQPLEIRPIPRNMYAGMVLLAVLCIAVGLWPHGLYTILPYSMEYHPFELGHLIEEMQLLLFGFLGFWLLRDRLYPAGAEVLDVDWLYRWPAPVFAAIFVATPSSIFRGAQYVIDAVVDRVAAIASNPTGWVRNRRLPQEPYDPNGERVPIGVSLAMALLLAIAVAFWTLFK